MPGSCTFGGTSAGIVHTTDQGGEGQDRDGDGVQRDSPFGWQLLGQGGGMVGLFSWMEEHRTHKEKENLEINFEADGSWWASLVVVVGVTVGVPGSRTSFKSSSINWKWPAWTIAALSYRIPPKSASFCWLNMTVREMMVRSDVCNSRCYW